MAFSTDDALKALDHATKQALEEMKEYNKILAKMKEITLTCNPNEHKILEMMFAQGGFQLGLIGQFAKLHVTMNCITVVLAEIAQLQSAFLDMKVRRR